MTTYRSHLDEHPRWPAPYAGIVAIIVLGLVVALFLIILIARA